jgi:fructose-bisphosphate aldolase class 1
MAVAQRNERSAQVVTGMKDEINRIADSAATHEARRLVAEEPNRIAGLHAGSGDHREAEAYLLLRQAHGQDCLADGSAATRLVLVAR